MAEPKKAAGARLEAAEKLLDDLFKEIRENTAETRRIREHLPGAPAEPPLEPAKESESKSVLGHHTKSADLDRLEREPVAASRERMKVLRSYDQSAISKLRELEGQGDVKFTETTPEQAVAAVMKHAAETLDLSDADRGKLRWRWNGPPNGPQSSVEVFITLPDDDETVVP